jgi:hypothetical protein
VSNWPAVSCGVWEKAGADELGVEVGHPLGACMPTSPGRVPGDRNLQARLEDPQGPRHRKRGQEGVVLEERFGGSLVDRGFDDAVATKADDGGYAGEDLAVHGCPLGAMLLRPKGSSLAAIEALPNRVFGHLLPAEVGGEEAGYGRLTAAARTSEEEDHGWKIGVGVLANDPA